MSASEACRAMLDRELDGWSLTGRCMRRAGHDGAHATDVTRLRLRWEQEVFDAVAEGEQADEPGQAMAPDSGEGDRS